MDAFVIRSNHGSDELTLWNISPGKWRARVDIGDLTAEARVYERYSGDALRLDARFADLARQWRGWDGKREWEALGLRLAATHDGLGHVSVDATLDEDYVLAVRWRVRASLTVDAGALDDLARAARVVDAG